MLSAKNVASYDWNHSSNSENKKKGSSMYNGHPDKCHLNGTDKIRGQDTIMKFMLSIILSMECLTHIFFFFSLTVFKFEFSIIINALQ